MKSLASHINESLNANIIDDLLDKMSDTLDSMVQKIEDDYNSDEINTRAFSEYDRKLTRAMIVLDLVRAFAKYTLKSDKLLDFTTRGTKGTIIISATIERDGIEHFLSTSVIYAGGHNIQRLHYRYLTTTSLPQQKHSDIIKPFEEKIKRLSKGEKIKSEINTFDRYISLAEEQIRSNELLTFDQKLQTSLSYKYLILKYSEINRDSYSWKEWENRESEYEQKQEQERIAFVKDFDRRTEVKKQDVKRYKSQIAKLEGKLEQLN